MIGDGLGRLEIGQGEVGRPPYRASGRYQLFDATRTANYCYATIKDEYYSHTSIVITLLQMQSVFTMIPVLDTIDGGLVDGMT